MSRRVSASYTGGFESNLYSIAVGVVDGAKAEFGLRFANPSLTCDELGHETGRLYASFMRPMQTLIDSRIVKGNARFAKLVEPCILHGSRYENAWPVTISSYPQQPEQRSAPLRSPHSNEGDKL